MSQATAEQQANVTTAKLAALLAAYQAGQIEAPDFTRAGAVATFAAKIMASRWADIAVSTIANKPPVGIAPGDQHVERLEEALDTILSDEEPAPRLELLAWSEVLESHGKSLSAAIREQGYGQWREEVAADACEVCQPFADEVHEAEEVFESHHPRCRCEPVPVGEPAPDPEHITEPIRPVLRFSHNIA